MEPITHFLTGACLGRSGFNRKTAYATATMVLAADMPDIDVLWYFRGSVEGFAHHRGFTHTLLGVPFDAAAALGIIYLYWRWRGRKRVRKLGQDDDPLTAWETPRWGLLYFFSCIAALSHILLDFTNNYGVRPFAPFYGRWYSWDIVFIVEPLLLAALFLGLVVPPLFGLVNEEIGSRRKRVPGGRGGAIFALACMVVLWMVRDFEHRRAVGAMQSVLYQGASPQRVSAYPYMINPFRWHGVAETADFFALVPVNSATEEVDPQGKMRVRYKPQKTEVIQAARQSRLGQVYLDWAQYPMFEVEEHSSPARAYSVRLFDLRFSYPDRGPRLLGAVVELDRNLKVVDQYFEREKAKTD